MIGSGPVELGAAPLRFAEIVAAARGRMPVAIAAAAEAGIVGSRRLIDEVVSTGGSIYGINTGFGELSRVRIPGDELTALQLNLIRSHAVGVGDPLPVDVTRAMMLLLANSLARGLSGVRRELIAQLVGCLNAGLTPVVPAQGSVGASGDLAQLAHLALALSGEGTIAVEGTPRPASEALAAAGLAPMRLESKEGLALINGTHLMAGAGALLVHDAVRLQDAAEIAAALTLDVLLGSLAPMDERIQLARGRAEQTRVAARTRMLLDGSELLASHLDCGRVQDPYSLRCIPQVLGATAEGIAYVAAAIEPELSAVTDNPLCFVADGDIVSGGNFHGQPLSLPLDMLAIVVAEIAAFSERRSFRLLDPRDDRDPLPAFLSRSPGTQSGLMILQYTAAALVAENAVLAHPAGAYSVPTSAGQEDFNSMGATAALKCLRAVTNALNVVAIELICASQALDLRRPLRAARILEDTHLRVRSITPTVDVDRPLSSDIEALAAAIRDGLLDGLTPALAPAGDLVTG